MNLKKKLLSIVLVMTLIFTTVSIGASAYHSAYKDPDGQQSAIRNYDVIDKPILSVEQYASAALDEIDRMLLKENITFNEFGLSLDITSVDAAYNSIYNTLTNFGSLLSMFGDLKDLNVAALQTPRRSSTSTSDLDVLYALFQFLADNKDLFGKVIDGTVDLGAIGSLIDISEFLDIQGLLKGMLYELIYEVDAPSNVGTLSYDTMVQALVDNLIVGKEDPITGEKDGLLPQLEGYTNFSEGSTYDFVERALQVAYNDILVPLVNGDLRQTIGKACGVVYADENDMVGDRSNLNEFAKYINLDYQLTTYTVPADSTLIGELNNIIGTILDAALSSSINLTWLRGDNSMLRDNIAAAAKIVIKDMGEDIFSSNTVLPTDEELDNMTPEQLAAFAARETINASMKGVFVSSEKETLREIAIDAVKQFMALEYPWGDYNSVTDSSTESLLDVLADFAAYQLNISTNADISYGQGADYVANKAADWVVDNFGGLLSSVDFSQSATGWDKLNKLVFTIIDPTWLPAWVGGDVYTLLVDGIIDPLLDDLDIGAILDIFSVRADSGLQQNLKVVLLRTVARVVNAIFPGAMSTAVSTFDALLSNSALKNTVVKILETFSSANTKRRQLFSAALPLVCDMLHLTDAQDFKFPQFIIDKQVLVGAGINSSVVLRNNSSGINTGATDKNGQFKQDKLYTYEIESITTSDSRFSITKPTTVAAGESVKLLLGGSITGSATVTYTMKYYVLDEFGESLTTSALSAQFTLGFTSTNDERVTIKTVASKTSGITFSSNAHTFATKPSDVANYTLTVTNTTANSYDLTKVEASLNANGLPAYIEFNDDVNVTLPAKNGNQNGIITIRPFKVSDSYEGTPEQLEEFQKSSLNSTIPIVKLNGFTNIQFSLVHSGGAIQAGATGGITLHTYNDYGINKLYDSEWSRQRQQDQYSGATEWANYVSAFNTVASVVCSPLSPSFSNQNLPAAQYKQYEPAVTALEAAIEALEETSLSSGTDSIEALLEVYSPSVPKTTNEDGEEVDIDYDDDAYPYSSMIDYVGYTYNNYRNERKAAQKLINSQIVPDLPENPTPEQIAAHEEAIENIPVIDGLTETYTNHRLRVYGDRLIKVQATKTHLNRAIVAANAKNYVGEDYTEKSWAAYEKAITFANKVNAEALGTSVDPLLAQSKVNRALIELVEAQKRLRAAAGEVGDDPIIVDATTSEYLEFIDNTAGETVVFGIPQGVTVANLAQYLTVEGTGTLIVEDDAAGILATGTKIHLLNADNETIKTLFVSIWGDVSSTNTVPYGDGYLELLDFMDLDSTIATSGLYSASCDSVRDYAGDLNCDSALDPIDLVLFDSVSVGSAALDYVNKAVTY